MQAGRTRLIDAAEIEFSSKGFAGASVLAIAQRAGVKQPLLNFYFGGKQGLWEAVVERAYAEAGQDWRQTLVQLEGASALDQLKALLKSFVLINIRHPATHGLVFMEIAQSGPRLEWLVSYYMRPFHDMLDKLIQECTLKGLMKPYPRQHASIMMNGMLTAVHSASHMVQLIYGCGPMNEEQARQHADQAIDALLHGMLTTDTTAS